ncbi:hypothetical protein ACTXT7_007835 [Hymenolepis weldensis]
MATGVQYLTWPLVHFSSHPHPFDINRFISHPGAQPSVNQGGQQRESRILEENGASQRRRPRRGKSDPKMPQHVAGPQRQVSESIENTASSAAGNSHSTQAKKAPALQNDFFPEKTGAELADMLRQIKFAQKFAWLAGEPSAAPLGLSSFNPGSVPTLHHATSSPDAITHIRNTPNGRSGGGSSGLLVPPVTPNTERVIPKEGGRIGALPHPSSQPTVVQSQPFPRPKTSVSAMPSSSVGALSSSPLLGRPTFGLTPSTSYSPFALSSGVQSVTNLAATETPTPTADCVTRTITAASSVNSFNAPHRKESSGKTDAANVTDLKAPANNGHTPPTVEQKKVSKSAENSESSSSLSSGGRGTIAKSQQQQHLSDRRSTEDVSSSSASVWLDIPLNGYLELTTRLVRTYFGAPQMTKKYSSFELICLDYL